MPAFGKLERGVIIMKASGPAFRVFVEPGCCWGCIIGEDSDQGACELCVMACPEVFEKPLPKRCARVRPGVDPTPYLGRIRRAIWSCPSDAIRLVRVCQVEIAGR